MNPANRFNAEYTVNKRMTDFLDMRRWSHPAWLPTPPTLVVNLSEWEINPPCISLVHFPVSSMPVGQLWVGDAVGQRTVNLCEISVWVSRGSPSYMAELRYFVGLAEECFGMLSSLPIEDSLSIGQAMPTEYKIDLMGINWQAAIEDEANPDILRQRGLMRYQFISRFSGE